MKKLFLVLVILSFVENTMAQLKMAQFPEKEKKEVIITYDSLTNVRHNNSEDYNDRFKHLVGQKITSFQSSDFWGSMRIDRGDSFSTMRFAENMDGKTFRIDSVNRYTFYMTSEDDSNNHFSLSILDSDDLYKIDFAWVCHGYFEKMKKLFLDKDLVYVHQDQDYDLSEYHTRYRFMDYNTKRNLTKKVPCNSVWKCTDVLVISDKEKLFGFPDYENRVILNIENEQYGIYYIFASELIERKVDIKSDKYFMTMEDFHKYQAIQNQLREVAKAKAAKAAAESEKRAKEHREYIIAKYGETYGSLILQGRVVIGMTKDQCIEALGHPTRINRTTTSSRVSEQWVYSSRYLYFENGVLVTIQD